MSTSNPTFRFPEVRVVEASAGSGKTYALAKRYVQLLLNPSLHLDHVPMRNILAITFTNKAAFEMKARILSFLKRIALGEISKSEEEDILKPINIDSRSASEKAFIIMDELIHNYNFFQVQTIDSFINALLSGCAFKIGLSSNFKIKRNYFEYLEYSLDQMIESSLTDQEIYKIFSLFLHQYIFLENKTGWFPKEDMLLLIKALFQQSNTYGYDFLAYDLDGDDLIKQKRYILKLMKELKIGIESSVVPDRSKNANKGYFVDGMDSRFIKSLNSFLSKYEHGFDFDKVSDYFAREDIPVKKGVNVPSEIDKLWNKIHLSLKKLSEAEAFSLFNPYIEVFSNIRKGFNEIAQKEDVLFLEELNKKACYLFDESGVTVEELYYRLATRFNHYLIDEFQDTSILQWKNLYLMIEEALSTGGSLFYVGDKKQAIYGFRGGEVKLFDYIQKQFDSFNVQHERLGINYRSQKAVIDFNNAVFSCDNLRRFISVKEEREVSKKKKDIVVFSEEDLQEVENTFHFSCQKYLPDKNGGYVKVEYVDIKKKEDRDEVIRSKLIALIKKLRERFEYKDIAILTRGNQEVENITSWLMEEDIFVESERTLNIKENDIICEIIWLLQFLNSPIDNLAFTKFIVGDIFSAVSGVPKDEMHDFVFGLRDKMRQEKDVFVYKEFRRKYSEQWDMYIDEFFRNVGLYPVYELMISIISKLKILESFQDQQGFVMKFLEIIKSQEEESSDVSTFLEAFEGMVSEDLYVNTSDNNSIKVLTIHKSKGLEFPVVILPFLGMDIHVGSGGGVGQQSFIMDFSNDSLELLRIKSKYLKFSEKLYSIWRKEYIKALLSELNSIYVALTRAEKEIYAYIPERVGNSYNVVNLLIPENVLEIGEPVEYGKDHKSSEDKNHNLMTLPVSQYQDWIDFLKDEFIHSNQLVNRKDIERGEILHYMFSLVGNIKGVNLDNLVNDIIFKTELAYPNVDDYSEYRKIFCNILSCEKLQQFFYLDNCDVFNETDISDASGRTYRIDRLIVKENEAWVIDYKSSRADDNEYQKQVSNYMRIVGDIYEGKKISGFLIYLDECTFNSVVSHNTL